MRDLKENAPSDLDRDILAHGLGLYLLDYMTPCPVDLSALRETASTRALREIHQILEDGDLSDFECVEAIVRVIESLGGHTLRHDF